MSEVATLKRCPKCGIEKERHQFSPSRWCGDGLSCYCKRCHNHCNRTYVVKYKPVANKVCAGCKIDKPAAEFYEDLRRSTRLSSVCRKCAILRTKRYHETDAGLANKRKWGREYWRKPSNQKRAYEIALMRKYKLTVEQYDELMIAQKGCCAGCSEQFENRRKAVHVDHCHVNGWVRGLLCQNCNQILGMAKDDPMRLYGLASYLYREVIS